MGPNVKGGYRGYIHPQPHSAQALRCMCECVTAYSTFIYLNFTRLLGIVYIYVRPLRPVGAWSPTPVQYVFGVPVAVRCVSHCGSCAVTLQHTAVPVALNTTYMIYMLEVAQPVYTRTEHSYTIKVARHLTAVVRRYVTSGMFCVLLSTRVEYVYASFTLVM